MNALNRRLIRMLVPACVVAAATGCKSLVDLKETPQTFVAPSTYFKTNDQAITAMNGVYALLMTWDNWINPAWGENMCEEPDIHCPDWVVKPEGVSAGAQQWWTGRTWTANFGIVRRAGQGGEGAGFEVATDDNPNAGQSVRRASDAPVGVHPLIHFEAQMARYQRRMRRSTASTYSSSVTSSANVSCWLKDFCGSRAGINGRSSMPLANCRRTGAWPPSSNERQAIMSSTMLSCATSRDCTVRLPCFPTRN